MAQQEKKYFINDNVVIPDEIMKMTSEERQAEIARIEKEIRDKKAGKTRKAC